MFKKAIKEKLSKAYALKKEEVFRILKTSENGLSEEEVKKRLKFFGKNKLPERKPLNFFDFLLRQINNFLVYIIFLAALLSLVLGRVIDAFFIIFIILLNIVVGAYQEFKAEKAFESLKKVIKKESKVIRSGKEKVVLSEEIVPGDILVLREGERIPADARIIESFNFTTDESSLTGEFFPQKKSPAELPLGMKISERSNMVFAGTLVLSGKAKVVVTLTGLDSYLGEVYKLLSLPREESSFQRKIRKFSRFIVSIIISIVFLIFIISFLEGYKLIDAFLSGVSLVVSAVPEGLLPLITIILIFGGRRILRRKSLVRRLSSLETLGSISCIVTDKTGTLTEGKMMVSRVVTFEREIVHRKENYEGDSFRSHILALKSAILSTDAFIENFEEGMKKWIFRGLPTEKAILLAGSQVGLVKNEIEKELKQIDFLPFNSNLKFSASLNRDKKGKTFLFVLGAPEVVLKKSKRIYIDGKIVDISKAREREIRRRLDSLTNQGFRVLSTAFKEVKRKELNYQDIKSLVFDLNFIGFLGLSDPLRKEAASTLKNLRKMGIRTIIATGDDKMTTKVVAKNLGLAIKESDILTGLEIEQLSNGELREKVKKVDFFAEVIPKDKLRIVETLRDNGEIVAMIGDGINDAPAIKLSDVGFALNSGSQVTKESSDLILLDNNLKTVQESVIEGRGTIENIRKVINYLISDDFSEIFLFIFALIFALPLPLLPTQILWINLIEDSLPAISLAFDKIKRKDLIKNKPGRDLIDKKLKKWMIWIGIITGLAASFSYLFFLILFNNLNQVRTALFTLMAFDSLLYAFSLKDLRRSILKEDVFSNNYLNFSFLFGLFLIIFGVYSPFGTKTLSSYPLDLNKLLLIFFISFLELFFIEIAKRKIFSES